MRCAAMRFSSDRLGVRRTSGAAACAEPPAATRRAVSARASARVGAAASPRRSSSKRPVGGRRQQRGDAIERQLRQLADVDAGERHRQRLALEPLAVAHGAQAADHVARHALLHQRALRRREGVQHVLARAHERALVARLRLALAARPCVSAGVKPA